MLSQKLKALEFDIGKSSLQGDNLAGKKAKIEKMQQDYIELAKSISETRRHVSRLKQENKKRGIIFLPPSLLPTHPLCLPPLIIPLPSSREMLPHFIFSLPRTLSPFTDKSLNALLSDHCISDSSHLSRPQHFVSIRLISLPPSVCTCAHKHVPPTYAQKTQLGITGTRRSTN
jgi:hypothetical protein